jgi:hypothetical protein
MMYRRNGHMRAARKSQLKETTMAKKKTKPEHETAFLVEPDDDGEMHLYVVHDGVKIAERGFPGTPQAKQWISLKPGCEVRDVGSNGLVVEFEGVTLN